MSRISSDPFYSLPRRGKVRGVGSPWETRLGGRGEETGLRRAAGWRRTNRILQTHRGSAAAAQAPAPAPAPGEMLMCFCRIWRVIGRREFGATSSSRCHWLGAICCSLCRELLAPPPVSFSFSAPLPPAAGPVPGTLRARRRSGAFPPHAGEDPVREWGVATRPGLAPDRRRTPGHRGSFPGNSGEAPGSTTPRSSVLSSRAQRRVGGGRDVASELGSRAKGAGGVPRGSPAGAGPGAAAEQWPCPAHQPRRANPSLRNPRGLGAGGRHTCLHIHVCVCVCVCVRARACVRVYLHARRVFRLGARSAGGSHCQAPRWRVGVVGVGIPSLCAAHRPLCLWDVSVRLEPGCNSGFSFKEKGRERTLSLSHRHRPEDWCVQHE